MTDFRNRLRKACGLPPRYPRKGQHFCAICMSDVDHPSWRDSEWFQANPFICVSHSNEAGNRNWSTRLWRDFSRLKSRDWDRRKLDKRHRDLMVLMRNVDDVLFFYRREINRRVSNEQER